MSSMAKGARVAAKKVLTQKVGPKECFKHIVLNELLKGMSKRYSNGWTYMDFTPGPGSYQAVDGGLSVLYAHGRKKFNNKETNFFQSYIASLLRFNGETNNRKLRESPTQESAPNTYPSNAGMALMHMDRRDKAVFIEEDPKTRTALREAMEGPLPAGMQGPGDMDKRNIKVMSGNIATFEMLVKTMMPPLSRRGMVTFDLDEKIRHIKPAGGFKSTMYTTQNYYINEMAPILSKMCKRWPTGTFYFPYPLTSAKPPLDLFNHIAKSGVKQILNVSMFFEGDPETAHSAAYAGSGIGAIIVNPPDNLAHRLHNHMPALKTEVFMPEILLDDEKDISTVNVKMVLQAKQPWDDVETSAKLPSWDPMEPVEFTEEQLEQKAVWAKEKADAAFDDDLDEPEDINMDDIYEDSKFVPDPEPLTEEHKREWQSQIAKQMRIQDPIRPTVVKVRKEDKAAQA